ncbi:MAG: alpha/beta fold hydrolase [Pseudomonadota bacterium]
MPISKTPVGAIAFTHNGIVPKSGGPAAIVFVHGAGGLAKDWPAEWRYMTNAAQTLGIRSLPETKPLAGRPIYAIDLPGHGQSAPLADAVPTVGDLADAVIAFIATQGIEGAIVAGHSLGGAIALTAALRAPNAVGGLVIVGSAARLPVTDQILDGLQTEFKPTVDMITKFCWSRTAPSVFREIGRRRMKATGAQRLHADFAACAEYDVRDQLADIAQPTLVVAGERDKMVPVEAAQKLADRLANATCAVIADAGHFLHLERTGETADAITMFLQTKFPVSA